MSFASVTEQLEIIRRGVEKIVPEESLAKKLEESRKTGQPLRIKYGIDPTAADVHLGHTVPLRKMRQFQELGHKAVIIIGNYTAMVGDPSGRDEARTKKLSAGEVEENARYYLSQVGKVVNLDQAEVHRNGDWFSAMNFADLMQLCGRVTVAQLLTRDDFSKRMKAEVPIFLHECLYPIMQAFDSVVIDADVELGGTEQLYSFMLARDLQKDAGVCILAESFRPDSVPMVDRFNGSQRQQLGVMSPILVGTDGTKRMGKSLGNYIGISENAYEMTKKFMQLPDDLMRMYYELLTNLPMEEVDGILSGHPKEAKVTLGKQIVTEYYSAEQASESAARWQKEIGEGAKPQNIPVVTLSKTELSDDGTVPAANLLKLTGLCSSTSDARRSIQQGAAKLGEEKSRIESHDTPINVTDGLLLWVGKKRFCKVELQG